MKFLCACALALTAGWWTQSSHPSSSPAAPEEAAVECCDIEECLPECVEDCEVDVECLPDGTCRVECTEPDGGDSCWMILECGPGGCEVLDSGGDECATDCATACEDVTPDDCSASGCAEG